jgi:hypothetical protein
MKLIQLYIPLYDRSSNQFPQGWFEDVRNMLTEKFGGVTIYTRAPASGFWKQEGKVIKDEIIIYEVIAPEADMEFWKSCKVSLEKKFSQDELIIRVSDITLVND